MATARDIVTVALLRINKLDEGEVAGGKQLTDGIARLNEILDGANSDPRGMMFATTRLTLNLDGSSSYSMGPSGSFLGGERPVLTSILAVYYTDPAGYDYPLTVMNDVDYAAVGLKTQTGTRPTQVYFNGTVPNASINLLPSGASGGKLTVMYRGPLSLMKADTRTDSLPPSYIRWLTWTLATELALEFGVSPDPLIVRIAESARDDIRRNNWQIPDMNLGASGWPDINIGGYRKLY